MNEIFKRNFNNIDREATEFVNRSFAIADEIFSILQKQGKTQKDLADALGKKESEVSKWMQGTHNFTQKTIIKIEHVLRERIIYTASEVKDKINSQPKTIYFSVHSGDLVKSQLKDDVIAFEAKMASGEKTTMETNTVTIPADDKYYKEPA